jgi:hypothetical protein
MENKPMYEVGELVHYGSESCYVIEITESVLCGSGRFCGYIYDLGYIKNESPEFRGVKEDDLSKSCPIPLINNDNVNHPSHYTDGNIEVIDYIEDKGLSYHLGNAVKYISRAGKKDVDKYVEDLEKAVWYINREIERFKALK